MTQAEYLEAEFRRYFPDATRIDVIGADGRDELIKVQVTWPENWMELEMEITSDDPWYSFNHEDQLTITIPFGPEVES